MTATRFARPLRSAVLTIAAFALLSANPALAGGTSSGPLTAEIKLDPVALAKSDNQKSVHQQIVAAAHRVCPSDDRLLAVQSAARACFKQAVRSGEAQFAALREAQSTARMAANDKSTTIALVTGSERHGAR